MSSKRNFKFMLEDGTVYTVPLNGILPKSEEVYMTDKRRAEYQAHLIGEYYYEKIWRNREILKCSIITTAGLGNVNSYLTKLKEYNMMNNLRPVPTQEEHLTLTEWVEE